MAFTIDKRMSPAVKQRIRLEKQICETLVDELIGQGAMLTVFDGEENTVINSSNAAEVNAAFRRLACAYHPDRSDPFLRATHTEIFRALHAAPARSPLPPGGTRPWLASPHSA